MEHTTPQGPFIRDPNNTYISDGVYLDPTVCIEPDAVIEAGVHLYGNTAIGKGSHIGPNAILRDVQVGENCVLESCTISESTLGKGVEVGPYSVVHSGCVIGDHAHIGTHAELKNATLGLKVQVGHFGYLGNCEIGDHTNIGAGTITENHEHRTTIGNNAFIGSDTILVGSIIVGENARTAAGAVVEQDVPAHTMALGSPARLRSIKRD